MVTGREKVIHRACASDFTPSAKSGRKWYSRPIEMHQFPSKDPSCSLAAAVALCGVAAFLGGAFCVAAKAWQQAGPATPVVVQPGAPGQLSKTLPPATKATLPPESRADVEFMQGMIMHHAQAVEMTALMPTHTDNPELRTLGGRISRSQADEIKFMK